MMATTGEILIGLDLGTTNAKAAAFTLSGTCLAEASVPYPTLFPGPFRIEQRPADWLNALTVAAQQVSDALGARVEDVAGIGLSAHGPSVLFVSATGDLLAETCATWQDERAVPFGQRLLEQVGPEWIGPGMPLSGFPARLACSLDEHPEFARLAAYALGVKDYLVGWLTGQWLTEPSSGPGRDSWWSPVFAACGWSLDRLARVQSSISVAGNLLPAVAALLGLPRPVPVVMGLNDGASATLANGISEAGQAIISVSTNGVVRVVMDERVASGDRLAHALFCWPYVNDRWIAGGFAKAGASALDWFVRAAVGSDAPLTARDAILAEAERARPGSAGVLFVPYLAGRGTPHLDGKATATFLHMTLASSRGELARAVLEGVAFSLREALDHFRAGGVSVDHLHISGGGMRSSLWRQILADVVELPLRRYAGDSTLGAAIVAAAGVGLYTDITTAASAMAHPLDETIPDRDTVAIYAQVYETFQRERDGLFPPVEVVAEKTMAREG